MSASPNLIALANFNGYNGNGPGNLLTDANGNLYGTTYSSIGTNSDIVFELQNTGSGYSAPITIASYPITDEIYPTQMIMDSAGDLYGIFDSWAAPTSYSTVVELKKTASGYSVPIGLAGFLDNSSYGGPAGAVAVDSAGDVFGTTKYGGVNNNGTLFEIVPSSSSATGYGNPVTLVDFTGANGTLPEGNLIVDSSGNLFGTTGQGGANGYGTVFELVKSASGYSSAPVTLTSFDSTNDFPDSLIMDSAGDLFGTTEYGGPDTVGTVFELVKSASGYSAPATLASFTRATNGAYPGSLVLDKAGDLFGVTNLGGANGLGTVFEMAKTASGYSAPVTIFTFNSVNGAQPNSLFIDSAGNLFGTASAGGLNNDGIVFELKFGPVAPKLTVTTATLQSNQTTVSLSGTIDTADAGLPVSIYDGSTLLGTTAVNAAGAWSTNVSVPGQGVHTLTAQATNTSGTGISNTVTDLVGGASATFLDGGQTILFSGSGDAVTLNGFYNTVNGSNGTINLTTTVFTAAAQTVINGGGNSVNASNGEFSLSGTNNNWDNVTGIYDEINLNGAQTSVNGSNNGVDFVSGTGNAAALYNTGSDGTDQVSATNGVIYLNSAQANVSGGGNTIYFQSGTGNAADLSNTASGWDTVVGSSGTVIMSGAQASILGGGDTVNFAGGSGDAASLYNTAGNWDTVTNLNGTVTLTSAQASVSGGGDYIAFAGGTGDAASLYNTAGVWDTVSGSNGTINLTSAQASVLGGGDYIAFAGGTGDAASLYNTAGNWDYVTAANATVYLTAAQGTVAGGGDYVDFLGTGDAATLTGTAGSWDYVSAANATVYLNGAQATVAGGNDWIDFLGTGDAVTLTGTAGSWDYVNAANGTVYLNGAQGTVGGGGNWIDFLGSGDAVTLTGTAGSWDYVNASNSTVYLSSAQSMVAGGGDTVDLSGSGDAATLLGTAGSADSVNGSGGTLYFSNAQAGVTGSGDTLNFSGTANTATVSGGSESFVFQPAFGQDTINGFASSDTMQLASPDFANWSALLGHMTQSGSNTLITLDAADTITLTGVAMSSLQQAQFSFK